MNNGTPRIGYFIAFFIVAVIAWFAVRSCRDENLPPRNHPGTTLETQRQAQVSREVVARSLYIADTLAMHKRFKARERVKDSTIAILSTQAAKAQHSAKEYRKTGKVEDCDQALRDCEEVSETKSYANAIQDTMIRELEAGQKRDRKEIARSYAATDSAFTGWKEANEALRKEKGKRWGVSGVGGVGVGKAGLTPFVGVGISYNLIKF